MFQIRPVEDADWPQMSEVAEEAHSYMPLPGVFSRETWERNWKEFSHNPMSMIEVLEIDGRALGAVAGAITIDPANDDLCACMMFWHIARAHRGQGIKLLKKWISRARERGAVRLTMNHLLDLHSMKLETLYLRMGMKPLEKTYIMEL